VRTPRLYTACPLVPGGRIELEAGPAHHAATVLRLRAGESIRLFDGSGTECAGRIARTTRQSIIVDIECCLAVNRESPLRITLAQGISRPERMDYTLQKAVELGVSAIIPLLTQRTAIKLDSGRAARRLDHWQKVIVAACEQCGRNQLPLLLPVASLADWLAEGGDGVKLLLRAGVKASLADAPRASEVTLLIGPEGGLAEAEVAAAERSGYLPVALGPRILRTETAALAAIALLQGIYGDLR